MEISSVELQEKIKNGENTIGQNRKTNLWSTKAVY